jgi:hypothetical protein
MEPLTFEVTMDSSAGGPLEVPFDVRAIFGQARPPVLVTVNGFTYPSTIAVYGTRYYVPLKRANAKAAGVEQGIPVTVTIELDRSVREVTVPPDLAAALDAAGLWERWNSLSYSHQREHVEAIEQVKRPHTRAGRINKATDMIKPADWPHRSG